MLISSVFSSILSVQPVRSGEGHRGPSVHVGGPFCQASQGPATTA